MTTRLTLTTRARTELQESVAGFWADSELQLWADEAHAAIVVATRQEAVSTATLANGTESYTLPTDFYLARRVEIQLPGASVSNWMVVQPLSIDLRRPGDPLNTTTLTSTPTGWYIYNNSIYFVPIPDQAYKSSLYYYKNATPFTGDTDTPSYPEGIAAARIDQIIVDYIVAKALTKRQDGAYTIYAGRYNAGLAEITRDAEDRGNANSQVVVSDWVWE